MNSQPFWDELAKLPFLVALLFLIIIPGVVIIGYLRRKLLAGQEEQKPPFTMSQLERMREVGKITEEEFRRLRDEVLEETMDVEIVQRPAEEPERPEVKDGGNESA